MTMNLKKPLFIAAALVLPGLPTAVLAAAPAPAGYAELLDQYCVRCHNGIDNLPAGKPLYLDEVDLTDLEKDAATWELVVRKLGIGAMPPQGRPHPGVRELEGFRSWLISRLDESARAKNDPGRYVMHRLNRTEYANAVRDLFGIEIDVAALLPPDGSDFGFDNVASGLQVTPALLERYVTAAMRISTAVVGDPRAEASETKFPIRLDVNQLGHVEGLPLGTRGGTVVRYNFPADGEYVLAASLYRTVDSADAGLEGRDVPDEFQILVDGEKVHSALLGGPQDHIEVRRNLTAFRDIAAERMKVRTFIKAGEHDIGYTFVERPEQSQDIYQLLERSSQDIHVAAGLPRLTSTTITGPFKVAGLSDNPVRSRLFSCRPERPADDAQCARQILSEVARRAYRRPVTAADIDRIMPFYERARASGDFEEGIRQALPLILTSASFLYRREADLASVPVGTAHPVSDLELASRLSFFLWSSIPDDELLTLAEQRNLRKQGVLEQQVRRMLADDRATALTFGFPDQWLALRNLDRTVPDVLQFPDWDYTLRQNLQEETRRFFDYVVRNDRSALELLSADYTFINDRIARHYGIGGVSGPAFRRVRLADDNRHGLLGQGSILALTSAATRTSPVFRGKWILTNLLDTPPLPPPEDVPTLAENTGAVAPKSVRERLETHRADAVCASCHNVMDPLGFALENFDATGRWRDITESGEKVDASGVLVDGSAVDGPAALRNALLDRPEVFVNTVTGKLLIYALGRGLETHDMTVVRDITRDAARQDYGFLSIIMGIVESKPFQMRTRLGPQGATSAAVQAAARE